MKAIINNHTVSYFDNEKLTALPIVFIHGFPFSSLMWRPQEEYFFENYRVITYDIRGHGDSDFGDLQYTIEYFVDDLLALLDFLKLKQAVICGLSMGGYIALRAYERFPERFLGLVLCDTKSEADTNEGKIKRSQQALQVKKDGAIPFAAGFTKNVFTEKSFEKITEPVETIKRIIGKTSPLSIGATLIALAARTDTTHVLPTINVPTLILVGEFDTVTPVAVSQTMFEKIPAAEMLIISNAGHVSNLENAEEFNAALESFLKKLKPA
ncbi:MAG: alpha/beta hydrolase [Ignavibacteriales bacterium]|nr:alpha/beta hydrolase [Ignavibacteriales bacterium]